MAGLSSPRWLSGSGHICPSDRFRSRMSFQCSYLTVSMWASGQVVVIGPQVAGDSLLLPTHVGWPSDGGKWQQHFQGFSQCVLVLGGHFLVGNCFLLGDSPMTTLSSPLLLEVPVLSAKGARLV